MKSSISERTRAHAFLWKAGALFLILAASVFALLLCRVPAEASEAEGGGGSKAISIVFDNSGSMYTSATWCRTIYGMELFTAMADQGDEIGIYPLNPIEVDGITYTREAPLIVQGGTDASLLRGIYTPSSLDTHIETITDAYNGLFTMDGAEKWLVILSDADIYYEDGEPLDPEGGTDRSVTQERLDTLLSEYDDSVNVVYLAIGSGATVPSISGSMESEVIIADDSATVPEDVIGISNLIYGRDGTDASSGILEFGQTETGLVVYVQGDDITDLQLADAEGNDAVLPLYTCSLLYSEAPGSGSVELSPTYYAGNADDTGLRGEVAVFGEIPEGTYTIRYEGTSSRVGAYSGSEVGTGVLTTEEETEEIVVEDSDGSVTVEEETSTQAVSGRRAHRARFRVLIVLLIIALAAVAAAVVYLLQLALPKTLRAKVTAFTLNGQEVPDVKRPYLKYIGGNRKSGRIIIGPRRGTTDFDYRLSLTVEALDRRYKKSCDRGVVIVSPPVETGSVISYTVGSGEEKYTFVQGETADTQARVYLGQQFTYTMQAQTKEGISPGEGESVSMVVELKFY